MLIAAGGKSNVEGAMNGKKESRKQTKATCMRFQEKRPLGRQRGVAGRGPAPDVPQR